MAEECTHDCSSCSANCSSRENTPIPKDPVNEHSTVKRVIAVVSGKGGVGKSFVTASLASATAKLGFKVGVLDADVTGPSIPKSFGLHQRVAGNDKGILPAVSKGGVKVMSLNLLTENETDPVVWRGPVIAGVVKQFWTDVYWGDIDYLFVDMPPGTGDVPLTVFQSLPVDGIIVVTSPQELVSMIVAKALNMANLMNVPVLGLIENYSYFQCPDCGKRHRIFGDGHIAEVAAEFHTPVLAQLPMDPAIAGAVDAGCVEAIEPNYLSDTAAMLSGLLPLE
jgi:Mrp family chromosome partitioning ATPase